MTNKITHRFGKLVLGRRMKTDNGVMSYDRDKRLG